MKLHIKEYNEKVNWADVIENNRDEIVDTLISMAKNACGRPQQDLYVYPDGSLTIFDNVGGNSWIDDNHFVVWTTKGYEYTTPEDLAGIYTEDFISNFKDYTNKDVDRILRKLADEYDYNSVDELIRYDADAVRKELIQADEIAYNDMVDDILDNLFDSNWADDVIDNAIEQSYMNENLQDVKFRVDVYDPSDNRHDALLKRVYVNASDKEDAKQKVFDELPTNLKNKFKIKDISSFEAVIVKG